MHKSQHTRNLRIAGLSMSSTRVVSDIPNAATIDTTLPAGKATTITTRTNDTSGTLTGSTGHGLATGAIVNLHWQDTNGGHFYRRNVTLGTVSGNSIPFSGGQGDALPVTSTVIVASVPTYFNVGTDGSIAKEIALYCEETTMFIFRDTGDTDQIIKLVPAGGIFHWYARDGMEIPLGGGNRIDPYFDSIEIRILHATQIGSSGSKKIKAAICF